MRDFKLVIAGYTIGFEASADGPELSVPRRFHNYLSDAADADILIRVHTGVFHVPENAARVFHAPFIEETDGTMVERSPDFWSVWTDRSNIFITTGFPLSKTSRTGSLVFSLTEYVWDLWIDSDAPAADPMEYPLDGLILYYLTAMTRDIFIHAAGVSLKGNGFLFTGISGRGKSTMARLWKESGADVIHDDRLIIRKSGNDFIMFNTPVYDNESPKQNMLKAIFIIEHGTENHLIPVKDAAAISQVMSNCIQHSWDTSILSGLLGSLRDLCSCIPVYRLFFRPDTSIIDYLLKDHD